MDLDEYKRLYENQVDPAPGWDALTARLEAVYPGQEPEHWAPILKATLGGPDPIDGISAYVCRDGGQKHLHFCTYGFSSLYYDEESVGGDFSGFGFELAFRLASPLPPPEPPKWVLNLLQNLGRYIFQTGRWFEPGQWMTAKGPICQDSPTDLVGFAFLADPTLGAVETPHGRVEFVQAFGITSRELEQIQAKTRTAEEVVAANRVNNPLLITDLDRTN